MKIIKKPYSEFLGLTLGDIESDLVGFLKYLGRKEEKPDDSDFTKKMKKYAREDKELVIENRDAPIFRITWRGYVEITPVQFTFLDIPEKDNWDGGIFELSKRVLMLLYKIKRGYI
jgi:hypothetical protein